MAKKYIGTPPAKCDICSSPITTTFYDARTNDGRWGNLCEKCFAKHTPGKLGVGLGQKYAAKEGAWEKVA